MTYYLIKFISAWILPPGLFLLALLAAIICFDRYKKVARIILISTASVLLVLSLPIFSTTLISIVEPYPALTDSEIKTVKAQAIVVLAGGRYRKAPEYGDATVNYFTLERLRYGARLSKQTGLPILVTGGALPDTGKTEAELMALTLIHEYDITPKWIENRSLDTHQNAQFSEQLLAKDRVKDIILVTHAAHMTRAKSIFERYGLTVTPAPTRFQGFSAHTIEFFDFMPSIKSLETSYFALHEIIGTAWYWIAH